MVQGQLKLYKLGNICINFFGSEEEKILCTKMYIS